ncbi:MAG: hypothetical protein BWY80_00377 [Firmicutes bacterium ADurb.Bin456]|nr:MAG: hypothetical protein BWY80_00377 [Firmicutes bacterium ADurb.Bin456]
MQYLLAVSFLRHINKIHNDDTADITETQLPANFLGRFQVCFENRVFQVDCSHVLAGIDIYGCQRFGLVNNQIASTF